MPNPGDQRHCTATIWAEPLERKGNRSNLWSRRNVQNLLVEGFVDRNDVARAIFFPRVDTCEFAHFAAAIRAGQDLQRKFSRGGDVARSHKIAVHAMLD